MRCLVVAWFASLLLGLPLPTAGSSTEAFDFGPWRHLPILAGGRHKPLDTLARETLQLYSGRDSFTDRATGRNIDPTALYLAMLFDWQGWQQPPDPHGSGGTRYFDPHRGDQWDRAPLIRVDSRQLRKSLALADDQRCFSLLELIEAEIRDPRTDRKMSFGLWAESLPMDEKDRSALEEAGADLAGKLRWYQSHRMGERLLVVPEPGSQHQQWISVAQLMRSNFDDQRDPGGKVRKIKRLLQEARAAYLSESPKEFEQATAALVAALAEHGPQIGSYPKQWAIDIEVIYNRFKPFRLAWMLTLSTFFLAVLSMIWQRQSIYIAAVGSSVVSLLVMLLGFGARGAITGWVPLTNMYESVVFMAFGTIFFGLIYEFRSRKRHVLSTAAVVASVALILADFSATIMDPSLRPLPPVLRSNLWLAVHVMTIMLSYAAFGLALGIGNIALGCYLIHARKQELIAALSKFTLKLLRAGVLLLAIGTILGGIWADYAWGRFWGWDPKEVWALITLLLYLAVLHARYIGWVGNLGLAAWSVTCFSLVIMAWYGVNYVLSVGLHSYGFGSGGGQIYVFGAVALQCFYVLAAVISRALAPVKPKNA